MESYPNIAECCIATIEWLDDKPPANLTDIGNYPPLLKYMDIIKRNGFNDMIELTLYLNGGRKMWKDTAREFFKDVNRRNKFFSRHKNLYLLLDHNS